MKKIPKAEQEKALKVACAMVSEIPLRELWDTVTTCLDDKHEERIATALDPRYEEAENLIKGRFEALQSKLDEGTKKALISLEDAWWERLYWRQIAGFYLGVAVANRFK